MFKGFDQRTKILTGSQDFLFCVILILGLKMVTIDIYKMVTYENSVLMIHQVVQNLDLIRELLCSIENTPKI